MQKKSSRCFALLAALPLALACEAVAPLQPLPNHDGGNAAGTCDPRVRFEEVKPVNGLNRGTGAEHHVHLSPDELTAYVSSGEPWATADILVAKRAKTMDPFGNAMPLAGVNGPDADLSVSLTADGLTLWMESHRPDVGRVYLANRRAANESFGPASQVTVLAGSAGDGDPYVLPDGSALYFTSWATTTARGFIYRAPLEGTSVGEAIVVPVDTIMERWPVVSPDELVLYGYGNDGTHPGIWMATRTSRDLPFGAPMFLSELDAPEVEYPQWISPDGCRLYHARSSEVTRMTFLFVAERAHE